MTVQKSKIRYSQASKARWVNVSTEDRTRRAKHAASFRWKNMDIEKRRQHAMVMVAARNNKKNEEAKV